jgi:hypothetical protein
LLYLVAFKIYFVSQEWWLTTTFLALRRMKQENCEFEASLCQKINKYHACNPSYLGSQLRLGGSQFKASSEEKVSETLSQSIVGHNGICLSSQVTQAEIRRMQYGASLS